MARARQRRRRLSMTSLIDVIFLLLLFFMLTSSFSKYTELPLTAAVAGGALGAAPPLFLQVSPTQVSLNGDLLDEQALAGSALAKAQPGTTLLLSLRGGVDAQRLTDVLMALQQLPHLRVTVLGA